MELSAHRYQILGKRTDNPSTLEFQPPELSDNEFLLSKPPGLWHFVTTAQQANTEGE